MIKLQINLAGITNVLAALDGIKLDNSDSSILRTASLSVLGGMRNRIQIYGKDSTGQKIGDYSKKGAYFSLSRSKKNIGRPLGKEFNGKRRSKFASGERKGQDHKSRYFPDGYFGWKTAMGANVLGTVNLTLTGTFFNQMTILPSSKGWGIGWADKAFTERAQYFQNDKYDKPIFHASMEELELAKEAIKRQLKNGVSR